MHGSLSCPAAFIPLTGLMQQCGVKQLGLLRLLDVTKLETLVTSFCGSNGVKLAPNHCVAFKVFIEKPTELETLVKPVHVS